MSPMKFDTALSSLRSVRGSVFGVIAASSIFPGRKRTTARDGSLACPTRSAKHVDEPSIGARKIAGPRGTAAAAVGSGDGITPAADGGVSGSPVHDAAGAGDGSADAGAAVGVASPSGCATRTTAATRVNPAAVPTSEDRRKARRRSDLGRTVDGSGGPSAPAPVGRSRSAATEGAEGPPGAR
jgi:hypothetical protein